MNQTIGTPAKCQRVVHGYMPAKHSQARQWAGHRISLLKETSGMCLRRYLLRSKAACQKADTPQLAPLDAMIAYFEPRVPHTDYDAKTAGYPIWSGVMETACKQLVSLRLKGYGGQRNEHGALTVTSFIALRANRKWHAFWTTQRRAALSRHPKADAPPQCQAAAADKLRLQYSATDGKLSPRCAS